MFLKKSDYICLKKEKKMKHIKIFGVILLATILGSLVYYHVNPPQQQSTATDSTAVSCDTVCVDSTACHVDSACVDSTK